MPARGTFIFYKGATFEVAFVYKANGVVVDMTGQTVVFHLLKEGKVSDVLTVSSAGAPTALGSTLTITDAVNGAFTLNITDEETAALAFTNGTWWISREDSGNKILIGRGQAVVKIP